MSTVGRAYFIHLRINANEYNDAEAIRKHLTYFYISTQENRCKYIIHKIHKHTHLYTLAHIHTQPRSLPNTKGMIYILYIHMQGTNLQ